MKKRLLVLIPLMLVLVAVLVQPLCMAEEAGDAAEEGEAWAGADALAEDKIAELAPDYEPWFSPIWEPPSGEIESLLFSTQAAIGALIIGYFFGYHRAKKKVISGNG